MNEQVTIFSWTHQKVTRPKVTRPKVTCPKVARPNLTRPKITVDDSYCWPPLMTIDNR